MKAAKRITFVIIILTIILGFCSTKVWADGTEVKKTTKRVCNTTTGQYGSTSEECHDEVVEETITHETVNAGLEDINFGVLAASLVGAGLTFYILSRITRKVYLFEY